jgi:preprotein translocase subunit SecY
MILQLLVGSKIISVNFQDPEERALYTSTQKVLAVLMTLFEAIAYIAGGAYGDAVKSNPGAQFLIVAQLTLAGICIMMMDELVQKGWGLGSGISLFIATSVSFQVFDGAFSLDDVRTADGTEYRRGALIFFVQSITRGQALEYGFWHPDIYNSPDMFNVAATILVFAVVIYVESMKIEIPVQHAEHRIPARYPIKFLYVSNIPVILVSALFANIYLVSNLLDNRYRNDQGFMGTLTQLLGTWGEDASSGQRIPTGGLAAYTTAPRGVLQVADDPFRAVIYMLIMTVASAAFAMVWVETAGMSARDVARQLIGAGMQIPGFRRHPKIIERYLNNYIPYAAFLGGIFIGLLASIADFMGAIGSGIGILLTTGIIRQYYEILAKERLADINPALAGILGIT